MFWIIFKLFLFKSMNIKSLIFLLFTHKDFFQEERRKKEEEEENKKNEEEAKKKAAIANMSLHYGGYLRRVSDWFT